MHVAARRQNPPGSAEIGDRLRETNVYRIFRMRRKMNCAGVAKRSETSAVISRRRCGSAFAGLTFEHRPKVAYPCGVNRP
jgi:hypothetical protein